MCFQHLHQFWGQWEDVCSCNWSTVLFESLGSEDFLCDLEQPFAFSVPHFHSVNGLQTVFSTVYYSLSKKLIFLKHKYLHLSFTIKYSTESFEVLVLLILLDERKRGRGTWIKHLIFSIWKCSFLYHCISQKVLKGSTFVPIKKNSFWNLVNYTERNCHPLNHS